VEDIQSQYSDSVYLKSDKGNAPTNGRWAIETYVIAIHWFWPGNMADGGKAAEWG
jgi:hypothetical protein